MDSNTVNNDSNATDQNIGGANTIITTTANSDINVDYVPGDTTTTSPETQPEVQSEPTVSPENN